jgi:RNA polymerase sigma-70 factor (ECF subfamily)
VDLESFKELAEWPMSDAPDHVHETVQILRAQAGDVVAFEELVSRYSPRLNYYLLKVLGRQEAAADSAQDVWLAVYRGLPRLRRPESFRTWLYRIARDRAAREIRDRRPQQQLIDEDALAAANSAEEEFTEEDAARIHQALGGLSKAHREVLILRFIEDMSYEEIAEVSGCNIGTVRSRIHYAKQLLRTQMEESRDDE